MNQFIGIPYLPHGRAYEGADCWGLVWLYYRDVLGLEIPSYSSEMQARDFSRHSIGPLIDGEKQMSWRELPELEKAPGDVVLIRRGLQASHVGIYAGSGLLLHSDGPDPSHIDRLDSISLRSRIVGFYRLKGL